MAQGLAETLMFLVFLVGSTLIGFYLLAYAARCILVVVQGTAGGMDRIEWTDEPILDWAGNSIALAGLVLIWLIPVGFLSRALGGTLLPGRGSLRLILLAGPALWLTFPIGALSSLSAVSRWVFFRPVIVGRMFRLFPATLLFYLGSALLLPLLLGPWYLAVFGGMVPLLVVAAPLSAAGVLIYARLLGRLAWRIVQLGPLKVRQAGKTALPRKSAASPRTLHRKVEAHDPWAIPEEEEPESASLPHRHQSPTGLLDEENCEPYGLAGSSGPEPPQQEEPAPTSQRSLDPEEEEARRGYGMSGEAETKPESGKDRSRRKGPRRRVGQRSGRAKSPPGSPFAGVLGFPWYDTSLSAWMWLSLGSALLGGLLLGAVQFLPPVGD